MNSIKNIFDLTKHASFKDEIFEELFIENSSKSIRIERIISNGQISKDWYDQETTEIVFLLQGNAKILIEKQEIINLSTGDYIRIPKHQKHKVTYTSIEPKCIWLAIHFE